MSYCSFAMDIGLTVERMIALLLFLKSLKASDVIVLSQFLKQTKDLDGKLQIENTSRPVVIVNSMIPTNTASLRLYLYFTKQNPQFVVLLRT